MKRWFSLILIGMMILSGCAQEQKTVESQSPATQKVEENTQKVKVEENVVDQLVIGESGFLILPEDESVKEPLTEELQEFNQLHTAVIYGIYNRNWDDPMKIDPESFPIYYHYLRSSIPGMMVEMGEYTNEETYQILVPQEAMEEVVMSHFDVPVERIRESSWYVPEQQAYELCGIGGGWECQIVSAKQEDDLLVMEYKTYTGQNQPMSHGTITAKIEGDSWKYLSVTEERYLSYRLQYPAVISTSYHDGAYWSTGQSSQSSTYEYGKEVIWRGDSLEDIIRFYEGKIEEIGGVGETSQPNGEDSWGWNGTYGTDNKPLSIEVYGVNGTYAIRIVVEE